LSFPSLIAALQRLGVSVGALAALGAELRLRRERLDCDPSVRTLFREVASAMDPGLLEGIDPDHQAIALALIQTVLRQAGELLENPARAPGWSHRDAVLLESQGLVSRMVVAAIATMAADRPGLDATLRRRGTLLDVGTGVGAIAIEAARAWPGLRVVGIDPWAPALALARKNVGASAVARQIELREQRAEQLVATATFTVAWFPGPFVSRDVADQALERIHGALVPGEWLIFGLDAPSGGPLEEALMRLRVVRSGGHPWTAEEVVVRLRAAGFAGIEAVSGGLPIQFALGRRRL
jgi:SAM-dependent methyltransferase